MTLTSKIFRFILTTIFLLVISNNLIGQELQKPRHALYFELGGAGFIYSFNYEYHLNERFAIRAGGMFLKYQHEESQGDLNEYQGLIIPITLNTFLGKNNHKLEIGSGIVIQDFRVKNNIPNREERFLGLMDTDTGGIGLSAGVGYRYQPTNEGLLFRIGLSVDLAPAWDYDLGGAFGISFGYIF